MSNDWDDKPLGYKQPPVWARFQKGRSGNPRGRPKKPKPVTQPTPVGSSQLDDALRAEKYRLVKVNSSGGPQNLSMYEVVVRSLAACAAKGDVHAQKSIWRLWHDLEQRDRDRKQTEDEREAKVFQLVLNLKADQAKKWAQAEGNGAEPDAPWPHPDDLIVNHGLKKWRLRGPYDEEGVPFYEYLRAERDATIASLALKSRKSKSDTTLLFTIWLTYDIQLPKRWQNFDRGEVILFWLDLKPLRELRALNSRHAENVAQLRKTFQKPWDKETYRTANAVMKPLLKHYGYRSLAELERHYEIHGDVPLRKKQAAV